MAQSPTVPVGAIIPAQVSWQIYYGTNQLQQKLSWVMPGAGTYVLETSADNAVWSPYGSFSPHSESTYSTNIEPSAPVTAYRMTKTSITP